MDYTGLVPKFKVNRPLTDEERTLQLHQSKKLGTPMGHQLVVIRINSTYLETTDKFYPWVGWLSLGMLMVGGMLAAFLVAINFFSQPQGNAPDDQILGQAFGLKEFLILMNTLTVPLIAVTIWGFLREAFRHTHYPIRFNRRKRMVHAFRYDGTIISAPWDKLFFTLGRGNRGNLKQNWDIRAHVLAEDGVTVLDTFSLGDHQEDQELLRRFWEMHRRYMEEGPRELVDLIKNYMPLENGKRESFGFGYMRWWINWSPSVAAFWIMTPFIPFFAAARWVAMRTSKVPHWPPEIEADCQISEGDPYERDSRVNLRGFWALWQ